MASSYADPVLGDITFAPEKGNVIFASGLFRWGVSLPQFAKKLATTSQKGNSKEEVEKATSRILRNLWGEAYFDPETKKIVHASEPGKKLERYVCKMFLGPLFKVFLAF